MRDEAKPCDFSNVKLYNRKYIPLFYSDAEFLHLYGSAGSGKSVFAAQKEIVETFDWKRRNRKTLIMRQVERTLKNSVFSQLIGIIHQWDLGKHFTYTKSPLAIVNTETNVEMVFLGLDDVEKLKSVHGADRVWIEEATELKAFEVLNQIRLRLRGFDKTQITLCYNPIDEFHWLNKEIHETRKPGHQLFHSTYKDNEQLRALDPKYFEYLDNLEGNYARVYRDGLWGKVVEGLLFENYTLIDYFGRAETETDPHQTDVEFYGLDFGFTDPTALVACRVQDALPKRELILQEVLYKSGLDSDNLVSEFNRLQIRKDRDIIADNARPELIAALRKYGYRVRACEKGTGSVLTGINKMRNFILRPVRGSKNLIAELNNYQKNQRQGIWLEEPATNQADHAIDATRYAIQSLDKAGFDAVPFRF